jgi:phosphoglycolate phosphatase
MAKQNRNFDLIVFDWDGTLMDSTALIVGSIQAACADMNLAVPERAKAAYVIGLSLMDAMRVVAPGLDHEGCTALAEHYRHHYLARDHELTLFEGAWALLEELRDAGYQLAIATGKARRGLSRVLENSGIGVLFDATRCADESFSKPHPGMLLELMDELMVAPERTLMIGDTTHDLLMAKNAGVRALAMSYGAHGIDELMKLEPVALCHSVAELQNWFVRHG